MVSLRLPTSTAAFWLLRSVAHSRGPQSRRVGSMPSWSFCSAFPRRGQRRAFASQPPPTPELIPLDVPVDEERIPGFKIEKYYPANPGDVLAKKYQLIAKLGWGTTSTVWLARDIKKWFWRKRYVAVKICTCDTFEEDMEHEMDINKRLSSANPQIPGRVILGTAIESYKIESVRGDKHLLLVFEPLREPLWLFKRRVTEKKCVSPKALVHLKIFIAILLEGLDYMHSHGHVIHTDLKLDNIMVDFEDKSTIEAFVRGQATHPMARKHIGHRTIYRCHNDFGLVTHGFGRMIPQITDFGLAQRGDRKTILIHPTQPDEYRAPEVFLGIGWSYSVDIWNFGAMIWELLTGTSLFGQPRTKPYSSAQHLADMIALIGPPPPSLIQRERDMSHWRWSPAALNPEGRLVNNVADFYGGPFFTDEGTFKRSDLIPEGRSLESEAPECILEGENPELFFAFMRRMLCWVPEERATAADLLKDPWLEKSTVKRTPLRYPRDKSSD